jgi:hypothetical protein
MNEREALSANGDQPAQGELLGQINRSRVSGD